MGVTTALLAIGAVATLKGVSDAKKAAKKQLKQQQDAYDAQLKNQQDQQAAAVQATEQAAIEEAEEEARAQAALGSDAGKAKVVLGAPDTPTGTAASALTKKKKAKGGTTKAVGQVGGL